MHTPITVRVLHFVNVHSAGQLRVIMRSLVLRAGVRGRSLRMASMRQVGTTRPNCCANGSKQVTKAGRGTLPQKSV
jgi:hypothetical protein